MRRSEEVDAIAYRSPWAIARAWALATSLTLTASPAGANPDSASTPLVIDPELQSGVMLRAPDDGRWGLRLRLPLSFGLTQFDLESASLDALTSLALVPTLEFIDLIDEHWTLLPFVGAGAAVQLGDKDPLGGDRWLAFLTAGLRLQRWQRFGGRYSTVAMGQVRYDATTSRTGGRLGESGRFEAAVELRRAFGPAREGPRFQAGVYAQGYWFWDPIEVDVGELSPAHVDNELELGVSVGSSAPYSLWILPVPRVFIGYGVGDGLQTIHIRFGRL